jgi:hypothetical protein
MMDLNNTYAGTATKGSDEYGEYIEVRANYIYHFVTNNGETDVLQGKVMFEENKQYCLKVKWRNTDARSSMYLYIKYTDGTSSNALICASSTPVVAEIISTKGKTVSFIRVSYNSPTPTRIYEIQLVQATKQPNDWLVAPEDVDAAINSKLSLSGG